MSLLIVGSVAFDTIKTSGGAAEDVLGGSALYCAYAASFFSPACLMSPVGEDMPQEHLRDMERHNIDTAGVQVVPGGKTFRWTGRYNEDFSERTTEAVELNVFGDYDTTVPESCRDAEFVFLANGAPEAQKAVLDQLPDRKLAFLDTMNHWIEGSRAALEDVLTMVDGLLVNDEEARLLTGERNLVAAARAMTEMGPRIVVIKKGEHGAILRMNDQVFALPAWLTDTVTDPTGAGDCFGGGLIGHLASRDEATVEAVRAGVVCGTVVASFCIEAFSVDRLRAITPDDIERRRRQFLSTVSWC
jgi:sugar/nucleoside kinase (ribokinase family)